MSLITLGEQGWALESFFGQDYVTAAQLTSSKKEGGSDAQPPATTQQSITITMTNNHTN